MDVIMQGSISRRLALKYLFFPLPAVLFTSQSPAKSKQPAITGNTNPQIKYIGDGFYIVNGWLISEKELFSR
ncbi:hypothetical protein OAE16_00020 [Porticoccaceae bacterium]|nr:hypothetical protein [Porticoccaceae bacterium]